MGSFRVLKFAAADHSDLWDAFVNAHPFAGVGHLRELFAFAPAERNLSLMAFDEAGKTVGVLPLVEVDQKRLGRFRWRILVSNIEFPAGPLTLSSLSARVQMEVLEALMAEVANVAGARKADEVMIAYPLTAGDRSAIERFGYYPMRRFGFTEQNGVGLLLRLSEEESALFSGLESNCRNMVRRCQKAGVVSRPVTGRAEWLACYDLNVETLGEMADSREYMALIWDALVVPGHAHIFAVENEGAILNIVVTVGFGASAYYWKSYRSKKGYVPGTNNLALWDAIVDCKRRGFRFFELGSLEFGAPEQVAISKFKQSFGGVPAYQLRGSWLRSPLRPAILDAGGALMAHFRARKEKKT